MSYFVKPFVKLFELLTDPVSVIGMFKRASSNEDKASRTKVLRDPTCFRRWFISFTCRSRDSVFVMKFN